MPGAEKKRLSDFVWPELATSEAALKAIRTAFDLGLFLCGATAVISILPLFGFSLLGYGLTDLAEVVVWGFLLWGLKRKSRICSVVLLAYYAIGKILFMVAQPSHAASSLGWLMVGTFYFAHGARGVFRYYRLTGETPRRFRWDTVLWTGIALFAFFLVAVVGGVAENIFLDLKLTPAGELLKQGKWEQAQAKADEILRPFSGDVTAEEKRSNVRNIVDVFKLYTSGMQAFGAKRYPEAQDLLKQTAAKIRSNASVFSLTVEQCRMADHELEDWKKVYHGDIPESSLVSVRTELHRWAEKSKASPFIRMYCDAILVSQVSIPAVKTGNEQKPLK